MNSETAKKMIAFRKVDDKLDFSLSCKYKKYENYLTVLSSGSGMIGANSYLVLWSMKDIEELNNDYAVDEFLTDIILIGSDGSNMAYGINLEGKYVQVPFIGMDDDEVEIIASDFDEFISYLYSIGEQREKE